MKPHAGSNASNGPRTRRSVPRASMESSSRTIARGSIPMSATRFNARSRRIPPALGTRYREYENTLDEVQVYRDVQVLEDRLRVEGRPPKARFFTPEEQREWERQYPTPAGDAKSELRLSGGEQT